MVVHYCLRNPCPICTGQTITTANQTPQQTGWICTRCNVSVNPISIVCPYCRNKAQNPAVTDRMSSCLCRQENGGSGICGCILGNQVIS